MKLPMQNAPTRLEKLPRLGTDAATTKPKAQYAGTMATQISFPLNVVRAGKSVGVCQISYYTLVGRGNLHTEDFHEDIVVDNLDANISIQSSSNQTT